MAISSVGIWAFHFMILRGVKEAAAINQIVTIAKVVPLLLFVVIVLFALQRRRVRAPTSGAAASTSASALFDQVRATMLVTVFVFLGVEGASVYSRHAKRREDVGKATVLGFLSVLVLFVLVTLRVLRRDGARRSRRTAPAVRGGRVRERWSAPGARRSSAPA